MTNTLDSFFNPQSIAVVGLSENPEKLGSIIFQNILDAEYQGDLYGVNPKHGGETLSTKPCLATIKDSPLAFDLVVIVVPAKFTEGVVDDCIENKTKNIIIISAGYGEIGNHELEQKIVQKCHDNDINLLGPNCLGAIFPYCHLNASFSDGYPKKGNIAFVSQSGAFCTAMLDWAAQKEIGFSHFISLGNKAGINEVQLLEAFERDENVEIIALYLESIADGKKMLNVIEHIAPKKPIVILEPGKSKAAQEASSSHTGSLSPNARVLQYAYRTRGALQVFSMREMFGVLETLSFCKKRSFGRNVALVTNAGGVGVLSSDLVEDYNLELPELSQSTQDQLRDSLPLEANVHNPVDIIGDARSDRYKIALEEVVQDSSIDQVLVLLTPQRTTEVCETARIIASIANKTQKPILASFIGGKRTQEGLKVLEGLSIPAFEFPNDAIRVMGLLGNQKQYIEQSQKKTVSKRSKLIEKGIQDAQKSGSTMVSEDTMKCITDFYEIDTPLSDIFTDKDKGLLFAQKVFPNPVVLKISSPEAVHKTDIKGVFLNVTDTDHFNDAWETLSRSIEVAKIPNANIQVQEQVQSGQEIIVGVHTDENFGKILLFGRGGIYTEIFGDTSLRILPTNNIGKMIDETKVGKILDGVRGQSPFAKKSLIGIIEGIQQLVLDYPEIESIDINPIIVTHDRAICVDLKVLV